jgi:hypothetical protein
MTNSQPWPQPSEPSPLHLGTLQWSITNLLKDFITCNPWDLNGSPKPCSKNHYVHLNNFVSFKKKKEKRIKKKKKEREKEKEKEGIKELK